METMHILMIIAAIVLIAVIALIRKIIAIVITIVILGVILVGADKVLSNKQKTAVVSFLNKGKDRVISLVKEINSDDIKTENDKTSVHIKDKWYGLESIKNNIEYKEDGIYLKKDGKEIKITSGGVIEFFNRLKEN